MKLSEETIKGVVEAIIDQLVSATLFESREDIQLTIYMLGSGQSPDGSVRHSIQHGMHYLTLYIPQDIKIDQLNKLIVHEMIHIFTYQFRAFYELLFCKQAGIVDVDSISFKLYQQYCQRMVKRLTRLVLNNPLLND